MNTTSRVACAAGVLAALATSPVARADGLRPPPLLAQAEPAADPAADPPEVVVRGHYDNAVGTSDAASQGRIGANLLRSRPPLRPAEVLEFVPGLVVTQHSGDGKANQYFLRGFNLDHGTDFATSVAGVPVNLPTHAHGHGYTDLNFLIPELVDRIDYRKGPYYAAGGDFSSAGSADILLRDRLPGPLAQLTLGRWGHQRVLAAASPRLDNGATLLAAFEAQRADGPWERPQDLQRVNGVLRLSGRFGGDALSMTLMTYDGRWNATDQVPLRAVQGGLIGRFGTLDPTSGGDTGRTSLSGQWRRQLGDGFVEASAWALRYRLDLYSNFTYALDRPDTGDQFLQRDRRTAAGGQLRRLWVGSLAGAPVTTEVGFQVRHDRIGVGLADAVAREVTAVVRDDRVRQTSVALYAENSVSWTSWLRTVLGVRADRFAFDVAGAPENSGRSDAHLVSPKSSLILGPWARTELFLNWGQGFHSNDARGTVARVDPRTGDPVAPVPGLVRTRGHEIGLRTEALPGLQSSLAAWWLDIGSELVFVGDAGTTEPSRPSRRRGLEFSNRWIPAPWLLVDLDMAWSRARFADDDAAGPFVPGSVARVVSAAVSVRDLGAWSGSLQLRHLGARPLTEDGEVRSRPTTLLNMRLGYRVSRSVDVFLDVFNLLGRRASDIEYFYPSRLRGESAAVSDVHFHPVEPRALRATLRMSL